MKHFTNTCFPVQKKLIAYAVTSALSAVVFPSTSFATATLQGHRFIDSTPFATKPLNNNNEPTYTADGYILFKPLNSTILTPFGTRVTGGSYSVVLPDGEYNVWQYVDPKALDATQLSNTKWAVTSLDPAALTTSASSISALHITVSAGMIFNLPEFSTVTGGVMDFPVAAPTSITATIPSNIASACNINDATKRKVVCGTGANVPAGLSCTHNYPSGSNWNANDAVFAGQRVFVYGDVSVSAGASTPQSAPESVCNYGTLRNAIDATGNSSTTGGNTLEIGFTNVFANFSDGKIVASDGTENGNVISNGSSIKLVGAANPLLITISTYFFNQGIISAGNGYSKSVDFNLATTFEKNLSQGGEIEITADSTYQYGKLQAGKGGDVIFPDCQAAWQWEHHAGNAIFGDENPVINLLTPNSRGGHLTISGNRVTTEGKSGEFFKADSNSSTFAGEGGAPVIQTVDPKSVYCISRNEIEGAFGGNLNILVANGNINSSGLKGRSVYVEPDSMNITQGTTIVAQEDIVLFGGDNWVLTLNNLSANALTAGRKIILATGAGGTIDLRGNAAKIFKAGDKVEIFTDNLLLDPGVTIQSLVDAPNGVTVSGAKIIYHATITGTSQLSTTAGKTVQAQLDLRNAGPNQDTYTIRATTADGVTVSNLASSKTLSGLSSTPLTLDLAIPATVTAQNSVVTITATSQADPTVVATFELRLNLASSSISCATPANYDTATSTITLQKIDVPVLSPLDGKPTGEITIFEGKLRQMPGVEDFQLLPDSLKYISSSMELNPKNASLVWNDGLFSKGGKLLTCVAVPSVVVINGMKIPSGTKNYQVTLRTLAVDSGIFHIEKITPAN